MDVEDIRRAADAPETVTIDSRPAYRQYEVLMGRIKAFESSLDKDQEVGMKLADFGRSITLAVTSIEYADPQLLIFHGITADGPATLIQSISKLNFLLQALPKTDPEKPAIVIGFDLSIGDQTEPL